MSSKSYDPVVAMKRSRTEALVGGIEAGGTKFVCAVGSGPHDLERASFPTGDRPEAVLSNVVEWMREQERRRGHLEAVGIGSFGPVDLHSGSATYGHITSTPKKGWQNVDLLGTFRGRFPGVPVAFDTDVNVAALGEYYWGNASGLDDIVYITIGTGIGAGGLSNGRILHGLVHPEMGHMHLRRFDGDAFAGVCPFHGACWEGLCSGPAMKARTGIEAENIPADDPAWSLESYYVGQALANIVFVLSPTRIILGGSVRKAGRLGEQAFFGNVRKELLTILGGYVVSESITSRIEGYVVPPGLGDNAGVLGSMALAQERLAS